MNKFKIIIALLTLTLLVPGQISAQMSVSPEKEIRGKVFWDWNKNGTMDHYEYGVPGIPVSNGREVVLTDFHGNYRLPAYDEMVVMISQTSEYKSPLDANNIPQFFYIHSPQGSPPEIQQYKGLEPSGPLPERINFPVYKQRGSRKFSALIMGDTQPYDDKEVSFVRDTVVKEISKGTTAQFAIALGDNVGDYLDLYPRFKSIMRELGLPVYLVPGNHDLNYDAETPEHSFDTFKREFGPTYYSFNHGDVHFVVLNSVLYPSPAYSSSTSKTYHGEISTVQMEWLKNDLAYVPYNKQIVLCMHIPFVSFVDRMTAKHKVANRVDLYNLLAGRKVLSLAGHTHTLEHFLPGEEEEGWGQATPFHQIIAGAVCGSWWSGDLDDAGIPFSYQKGGAPRGYMIFDFDRASYTNTFKATGKDRDKQMAVSFRTESFRNWAEQLQTWAAEDPATRSQEPPLTLNDLPDQKIISKAELEDLLVVINAWNAKSDAGVIVNIDGQFSAFAIKNSEIGDPYALRNQLSVLRYYLGFSLWRNSVFGPAPAQPLTGSLHTNASTHIWTCKLPGNLATGAHTLEVYVQDKQSGTWTSETMVFELSE